MKAKNYLRLLSILWGTGWIVLTSISPLRADERDDRVEQAFRDSYIYHTQLKDADVSISSKAGAVTLTGRVATDQEKQLAQDTAAALPGVGTVDNQLIVPMQPAEASDDWVALKVRGTLLFHRNVSLTGKQVIVNDGIVTLTGTADNDAEKALAGEYAVDVKGVKSVVNKLAVGGQMQTSEIQPRSQESRTIGEKIDDASITAQAKYALAVHQSTSALRTQVATQDGVVTIRGPAKNAAEKALVTKLTEDIQGVKDVRNERQVQVQG
jgi:osmotically-inducible protein OsmY